MKIAVVGSEGQIAHSLRILGRARGLYVFSAGRPEVDLTRPQSVGEFLDRIKPDLVVNAAAYTAVDKAENDSEQAFLVNATGAGEVARLCSQINRPLVHISTDFVFDGSSRTPYVETDAVLPLNVYGASKAAGEVAVRRALVTEHHHSNRVGVWRARWKFRQDDASSRCRAARIERRGRPARIADERRRHRGCHPSNSSASC